ncbi:MAG TPA: CGNR zinc finger domain-containing protein [Solirubrobacteraceae bacterium]|nr:CGNR zinc finger domain-containing protein [Solirubrobacteraceae bacterium]
MATKTQQVPNGLSLVIDYVNTVDRDRETDALSSPRELGEWLRSNGLLERGAAPRLSEGDLRRAVEVREELRKHMFANNGNVPADWLALDRLACRGRLQVRFTSGGEAVLEPEAGGLDGALARLLVPVALAVQDGSWERVKACAADDCQWAFYDRSRNHSGRWCEMAVCGNRTKVRSYRARAAGDAPPPGGGG